MNLFFFFSVPVTLAAAAVLSANSDNNTVSEVKKAFDSAHIPADLHITFDPKTLLGVTFPQSGSLSPITIHPGMQLSKNASSLPPAYTISPRAKSGHHDGPFVIAMVDPDVPTPQNPNVSQIRHFLGGNFFLGELGDGSLVNKTPAVTEYTGPHPADTSDPHRYVFLLFKQSKGFNEQKEVNPETSRTLFNISSFAEKVGLGDPLGGTFMIAGPHT